MNTVEILEAARDLLRVNFGKHTFEDQGNYCAIGALNKVVRAPQDYLSLRRNGEPEERAAFFLGNAITGNKRPDCGDIVEINDCYGKAAILKAYDRAISNAKRRHISRTPLKLP